MTAFSNSQRWALPPVAASTSTANTKIANPPSYTTAKKAITAPSGGASNKSKSPAPSPKTPIEAQRSLESLKQQKAWDIAFAPAKSVPMQAFMVYMSGGGVQIFSMMIIYQLLSAAIAGMMTVNKTFEHLTSQSNVVPTAPSTLADKTVQPTFTRQKIVHCLSQGLLLGLGLYKCHSMGLLPTHESDWLAFKRQPIPMEMTDVSLNGWWHTTQT